MVDFRDPMVAALYATDPPADNLVNVAYRTPHDPSHSLVDDAYQAKAKPDAMLTEVWQDAEIEANPLVGDVYLAPDPKSPIEILHESPERNTDKLVETAYRDANAIPSPFVEEAHQVEAVPNPLMTDALEATVEPNPLMVTAVTEADVTPNPLLAEVYSERKARPIPPPRQTRRRNGRHPYWARRRR